MTVTQAKALLKAANDTMEWDAAIYTIMGENGGVLPDFWQESIIKSGFATKELERFRGKKMHKGGKPNYELNETAQ